MPQYTIYHNPRCSKSRATLQLLNDHGADVQIIKYLENPPSVTTLAELVQALDLPLRSILRTGEAEYREAGLADLKLSDSELLELIHQHPRVLERPIVTNGNQAVIGRPPENVLALLS